MNVDKKRRREDETPRRERASAQPDVIVRRRPGASEGASIGDVPEAIERGLDGRIRA